LKPAQSLLLIFAGVNDPNRSDASKQKNAPLDWSGALQVRLVAAAATSAGSTSAIPTTTSAAARAVFSWTSQVYLEWAVVQLAPIEQTRRLFGLGLRGHFHKAKTLGAACFAIHDD
jgi:hypothetical protein